MISSAGARRGDVRALSDPDRLGVDGRGVFKGEALRKATSKKVAKAEHLMELE